MNNHNENPSFEDLLFDLNSPIEENRKKAVMLLVKTCDNQAIPHLNRLAADDESPSLRFLAKQGIFLLKSKLAARSNSGPVQKESIPQQRYTVQQISSMLEGEPETRLTAINYVNGNINLEYYTVIKNRIPLESDAEITARLIRTISKFGIQSDVHFLRQFIRSESYKIRFETASVLADYASNDAYGLLILFLLDPAEELQQLVLASLKLYGLNSVILLIESVFKTKDEDKLEAAVVLTGHLGNQGIRLLEKALSIDIPRIRERVLDILHSLAMLNFPRAVDLYEKYSGAPETATQDTFAFKKGEVSGFIHDFKKIKKFEKSLFTVEEVTDKEIIPLLKSRDRDSNIQGISMASQYRKFELVDHLVDLLSKSPDTVVKGQCLKALATIGGHKFLAILSKGLKSRFPEIRASSVSAMKIISSSESLAMVIPLLDDDSPEVRAAAVLCLADHPNIDIIKTITGMVHSDNRDMQRSGFHVLANLEDRRSISLLIALKKSSDPALADLAENTLQVMAGNGNIFAQAVLDGRTISDLILSD
ncbi:MAG: HEAT repeat domain-containing protein [Candidatus Wallbacteria bacterium]|nr:HEAT repeat domain-containing protein [Candidatus Wallbacteria bacterium]